MATMPVETDISAQITTMENRVKYNQNEKSEFERKLAANKDEINKINSELKKLEPAFEKVCFNEKSFGDNLINIFFIKKIID